MKHCQESHEVTAFDFFETLQHGAPDCVATWMVCSDRETSDRRKEAAKRRREVENLAPWARGMF